MVSANVLPGAKMISFLSINTRAFTVIAAGTSHSAPPLIDVDGTLFIQLGLFLILYLVLRTLVFKPYLALRAEQHERIEGSRSAANQMEADAAAKLKDYETRLATARKHASIGRGERRAEGEAQADRVMTDARTRAEQRLAKAREQIGQKTPAAEQALRTHADELAQTVAERVLGRSL